MTQTIKPLYATTGKAVTITLASLASSATAGRESNVVDNTSDLYSRIRLHVSLSVGAGTIANDQMAYVWLYGQALDATPDEVRPSGVAGTDAAVTTVQDSVLIYVGAVPITAQSSTFAADFLVANVPRKWAVVVRNYCGIALSAGTVTYLGENDQAV